ncbi:MAG: PolC-type DNA polymerase III [Lachnospiraceae bacterium]
MAKSFFAVFPALTVTSALEEWLDMAEVLKVVSNSAKTYLNIHISCDRWVEKDQIFTLEKEIKQQLFDQHEIVIQVVEHFKLSAQYTPENFYDVYRFSMMNELREHSRLLLQVFQSARMTFTDPKSLHVLLADSVVSKNRSDEFIQYLHHVFCKRAGFTLDIQTAYAPPVRDRYTKKAKQQMHQEIEEVVRQFQTNSKKETKAPKETSAEGENGKKGRKAAQNPDLIFGRNFDDESTPMEEIVTEMEQLVLRGHVTEVAERPIRNEKTIMMFDMTDYTDSIGVKIFVPNEEAEELRASIKKGAFLAVKGTTSMDKFDKELVVGYVYGIKTIPDFRVQRRDVAHEKRVELHCHTKMSDMDAVTDVADLVKRAYSWGHKAIAITDHGVVQAFPGALHAVEDIERGAKGKGEEEEKRAKEFKVIYGVEGYLVDDTQEMAVGVDDITFDQSFVVFDLETTGLNTKTCEIIEIGAVRIENGKITEYFSSFVNPHMPLPYAIERLTGIRDSMLVEAPSIEQVLPDFLEFSKGAVLVAHNARYDISVLESTCSRLKMPRTFAYVDTLGMAHFVMSELSRFKLGTIAKALGIKMDKAHRALDDATATAYMFLEFCKKLNKREIHDFKELIRQARMSPEAVRKLRSNHVIILATTDEGRVNLYKLISLSHLKYYEKRPKIPKTVLQQLRSGLLIGSACEAGEVYQALLNGAEESELARIVSFYDYLEIQPRANNFFMIENEKIEISSEEDILDKNREIVRLGELFQKPVVATCDVHFMDPEDEKYRRIILSGRGFSDADEQPPLYLRTTAEMLEEFAYLGGDKAEEVVITNPNKIADLCEKISPVHPDKCPPEIENSDRDLRNICSEKAYSIYGNPLPKIVEDRLQRELDSIISNGYAVMYIIAQKLVSKSNEDGYLVGSRGSVGSSFAATMARITEVNPLEPHYYCPSCKHSEFDSPEVLANHGKVGCDLPDKVCPVCGATLCKDGFNIPFETFLGFKGDKEPDIDLNFSGEYQAIAQKYTEDIFGKGQTFKAGTISKLADKTAYGYVKNYLDEHGIYKRNSEINRLVQGCAGVRKSTGQHPGGIIVLPIGYEIESFTPVQRPANDMKTDIITTHFDYHSIDSNLLKLDLLGHDDPTMIKMLEDLSGVKADTIPLDQKEVLGLFSGTQSIGLRPEDIGGYKLGTLGIPEFGTDFVMQMLLETKPTCVSDLVRISGLSHGTDVWIGNAQELIQEHKATLSTAICTRDGILEDLTGYGMDSSLSFTIMESVRKGKGLRPEWEEEMVAHEVPEWYIESCKKIKYMFPKAHAAAYVTMAFRIGYYKVFYPRAYYAAYFSIRAKSFSYELMCQGQERLLYHIKDYSQRVNELTAKEQDTMKDMRLVQEMYARGLEFEPIDIYKAKAHRFQVVGDKIMPSLDKIEGLGDKAADAVEQAAAEGEFYSIDEFRIRTKTSKTVIELMHELGLFGDMPQSNQLSLFDLGTG